jgi:hypothetical protein
MNGPFNDSWRAEGSLDKESNKFGLACWPSSVSEQDADGQGKERARQRVT